MMPFLCIGLGLKIFYIAGFLELKLGTKEDIECMTNLASMYYLQHHYFFTNFGMLLLALKYYLLYLGSYFTQELEIKHWTLTLKKHI